MIRKVLLPLDVVQDCQQLIRYGAELAASLSAELCLLQIAESSRLTHRPRWPVAGDADIQMFPSGMVVRRGGLAESIASYATSAGADLIFMPACADGILGQIRFDRTALEVLRLAGRPLWLANPRSIPAAGRVAPKRLLVGVEVGASAKPVLEFAARLARAWSGELLVVHAAPEISEALLMEHGLDGSGEVELQPGAALRRISSMAATIGAPCQIEVLTGDAAGVLRKFAKEWQADIVVAGRGGRADRRQLGRNIGDILARSPCPVIVYPDNPAHIRPPGPRRFRRATPVPDESGLACLSKVASQGG